MLLRAAGDEAEGECMIKTFVNRHKVDTEEVPQ